MAAERHAAGAVSASAAAPPLREAGLLLARLAVGAVFVRLSLSKIAEPVDFLRAVRGYGILPEEPYWLLNVVALSLPWLELLGGLALLAGVLRRGVPAVLVLMLAAFTAAVAWRARGIQHELGYPSFCDVKFDCGCGTGVVEICPKIVENLLLLGFAALLWSAGPGRWTARALWRKPG